MVTAQDSAPGGRFLPKAWPDTRNAAELPDARAPGLAGAVRRGHADSVVEAHSLRAGTDCLIRYPSPDGRCGGLVRPPSVFSGIPAASPDWRSLAQGDGAHARGFDEAGNLVHVKRVQSPGIGDIRKGRQSCKEHSSRSLPGPGFSPSRHVATHSANRPFWGPARGPARRPSSAAASPPARLSARPAMSPIARPIPAAAGNPARAAIAGQNRHDVTIGAIRAGGLFICGPERPITGRRDERCSRRS